MRPKVTRLATGLPGLPDEHFRSILDRGIVDAYVSVTDEEAFAAGIRIARSDGMLVGPTTVVGRRSSDADDSVNLAPDARLTRTG